MDKQCEESKGVIAYMLEKFIISNMNSHLAVFFLLMTAIQFQSIKCGNKMDLDGLKDMLKPMSKSCKTKTGASDALVAGTKNGLFPKERPLMCYFRCILVMLKAINKQGGFTLRDLNKQIDLLVIETIAVKMKETTKKCIEKIPATEDSCELAFNIMFCGYKEDPSLYFLPV